MIGKLNSVLSFDLLPWDLFSQNDPAVVATEFAAEGQIEVGKFRLSIHSIHARTIREKCTEFYAEYAETVHYF